MIDPFSRTKFHPELKLETWYPEGLMDGETITFMIGYIGFAERVLDEPFHRFADLSKVTGVHLDFMELADAATERSRAYSGRPAVQSAFFAPSFQTYGLAGMFAALMEPSPIAVRAFRKLENAAQWLGVPVEALHAER